MRHIKNPEPVDLPDHITLLPTYLCLGYREWAVELMSDPGDGKSHYLPHGFYDPYGSLNININFGPRETVNTLLHELTHAVFHLYNLEELLELPPHAEEKLCTLLGNGYTELFVRNPEVLTYLWGVLHGDSDDSDDSKSSVVGQDIEAPSSCT